MEDFKPPKYIRKFKKGKITPFALLSSANYLFYLATKDNLGVWLRVVLAFMGSVCMIVCLMTFEGKLPCKYRVKEKQTTMLSICPRDFGYLVGLVVVFICTQLFDNFIWKIISELWLGLGNIRFLIIFFVAIPTVIQGSFRRITKVKNDSNATKLILFLFGFLNSSMSFFIFLEYNMLLLK